MNDLEFVRVRECPDGSHPEGDGVDLLPTLSLRGGIVAQQDFTACRKEGPPDPETGNGTWMIDGAELTPRWMDTFVRYGAVSWNLHDPDGPVWPFDVERLLSNFDLAWPVADKADDLYREAVLRPLGLARPSTSPSGPMGDSTSPRPTPIRQRRKSSSRGRSGGQRSQARTA